MREALFGIQTTGRCFEAQLPGTVASPAFWVMSTKPPETRVRRLGQLIEASAGRSRFASLSGKVKDRSER